MNLPELCIRRPVMTTLLMAAFVIFGIIAYRALPVSELPNVDFPTISVSANLPGASPETMAATVATPLEGQFSTIAGLDSLSSTSSQGATNITLQFSLDRSIDDAAQDVQSAIAAAQRKMPPGMPNPPSFRKVNPADAPIFFIALSSPTLPLPLVNEYAEFTRSFTRIKADDIGTFVDAQYASQKYWPEPLIQVNPNFQPGGTVEALCDAGQLSPACAGIFRFGKSASSAGQTLPLYRHQVEAISLASAGESYVLTTGTGSGKSLSYFIPIIDHCIRCKHVHQYSVRCIHPRIVKNLRIIGEVKISSCHFKSPYVLVKFLYSSGLLILNSTF